MIMQKKQETKSSSDPTSIERRKFLKTSMKFGFTTALVSSAAGTLTSGDALAQTAQEEAERKASAKYQMTFATAYIVGSPAPTQLCNWILRKTSRT